MTLQKTNKILPKSLHRLSVQVSLTGLSFLVTDSDNKKSVFFSEEDFGGTRTPEEILIEIERVLDTSEALQYQFDDVSLIFANNIYSIIPNSLFDETKASEYLKFNSKILSNDYITHDSIENHDLVTVYVPYVNITNYFFDRFGTFQYFHSTSVLLKTILDHEKHTIVPKVYIHVQKDFFDCIIVRDGTLQLCNSYPYRTPEDFIYYILFCLEQLQLNPDTVNLYLCGNINENDDNYEILYNYIRNINFTDLPALDRMQIDTKDDHHHFILKNNL